MDEAQQDRQQLLVEKRKWQTELENKKRQLEDDRRALQHLKSKALRERWLLDGAPSAGPEQDEVRRQLEQDEAKTRSLEEAIDRLEKEVVGLESGGVDQTVTQTTVSSGSVKAAKVKGHSGRPHDRAAASDQIVQVVHEMNGEDGVQPLSSSEVEELLTKADKTTSVTPQGVATVTPQVSAQEEVRPESPPLPAGVTGLETSQGGEPSVAGASAENPVTMVFMGYQSVEDEDETKKVLGLKGTVKAELVLIHDANGKTSPGDGREEAGGPQTPDPAPPPASAPPPAASPATPAPSNREAEEGKGVVGGVGEGMGAVGEGKKEKQPCKCCSIM
ncbi:paralemmin 1a isoform X5 [Pungitius pungitius]|uniref:paralemmin 1a isoform X5 n=1 Tax=Pungitius pungitius TaxID=134920 RepID=UPI002E0ED47D